MFRFREQYVLWLIQDVVVVTQFTLPLFIETPKGFDPVYWKKKMIYLIMAVVGLINWISLQKTDNKNLQFYLNNTLSKINSIITQRRGKSMRGCSLAYLYDKIFRRVWEYVSFYQSAEKPQAGGGSLLCGDVCLRHIQRHIL